MRSPPVTNRGPFAAIVRPGGNPIRVLASEPVTFEGSCTDPDADEVAHAWTFDGATPARSTAAAPTVLFAEGSGEVTYQCTDASGLSSILVRREVLGVVPAPETAKTLEAASATQQGALAGTAVTEAPAVLVRDGAGEPVAGVPVAFEVVQGGGALAGASGVSGADGIVRVASWTLGVSGAQEVRASAAGLGEVTFAATIRTPATSYDITLIFLSETSEPQRLAFTRARDRIQSLVTGDLPDVTDDLRPLPSCGDTAITQTIDDLVILVDVRYIDGPYEVLGQAGPCFVRNGSKLPVLGIMEFDSADLEMLEGSGRLESVILHEMLHVVGFGTIWEDRGLLDGAGTADPHFVGVDALAAFETIDGGAAYGGLPVPVENTGGDGTRDGHWRETVFGSELMTGWISGKTQPVSATTIASLADLGYVVDLEAADPMTLAAARAALHALEPDDAPPVVLDGDVRQGPIYELDP